MLFFYYPLLLPSVLFELARMALLLPQPHRGPWSVDKLGADSYICCGVEQFDRYISKRLGVFSAHHMHLGIPQSRVAVTEQIVLL